MAEVPAYFDGLIAAFRRGKAGRSVHLGHFDEPAAVQRGNPEEFQRAQRRLDTLLVGMAEIRDGQAVLDVGCGLGGTLEMIDHGRRDVRLVGLNIDPRQIEICRTIAPSPGNSLAWTVGDACGLPFHDAYFDRVLSIEAMFHFSSRRRFFAEAGRVLRPGGALVASDIVLLPAAGRAMPGLAIGVEAMLAGGYGPWPDVIGADADHAALAEAAGLRSVATRDASAETLPSFHFTLPAGIDESVDPVDRTLRAGLALRWLLRNGLARYLYLQFEKPE